MKTPAGKLYSNISVVRAMLMTKLSCRCCAQRWHGSTDSGHAVGAVRKAVRKPEAGSVAAVYGVRVIVNRRTGYGRS